MTARKKKNNNNNNNSNLGFLAIDEMQDEIFMLRAWDKEKNRLPDGIPAWLSMHRWMFQPVRC